jgi:hypothetical protein
LAAVVASAAAVGLAANLRQQQQWRQQQWELQWHWLRQQHRQQQLWQLPNGRGSRVWPGQGRRCAWALPLTGSCPSWSSLLHLGFISGTFLRARKLLPFLYCKLFLAGAKKEETKKKSLHYAYKKNSYCPVLLENHIQNRALSKFHVTPIFCWYRG